MRRESGARPLGFVGRRISPRPSAALVACSNLARGIAVRLVGPPATVPSPQPQPILASESPTNGPGYVANLLSIFQDPDHPRRVCVRANVMRAEILQYKDDEYSDWEWLRLREAITPTARSARHTCRPWLCRYRDCCQGSACRQRGSSKPRKSTSSNFSQRWKCCRRQPSCFSPAGPCCSNFFFHAFRGARWHLAAGGVLIFDMNTFEGLQDTWHAISAMHASAWTTIMASSF